MTDPPSALATLHGDVVERAKNPFAAYLTQLDAEESKRTMRGCLARVAGLILGEQVTDPAVVESVPWHRIGYSESVALRDKITSRAKEDGWSLAHTNKHLAAVRGVISQSWELGHIDADTRARACKILKNVKGTRKRKGKHIEDSDIVRLLKMTAEGGRPIDKRDAAIISAFHATGGRCSEVAAMRVELYDQSLHGTVFSGKGNKERDAFLHDDAALYMDAWLAELGATRGPVFRPIDQWGHVGERAITARSLGRIIDTRRKAAGLPQITTHDFRRTLVGDMLSKGIDLATVQEAVGHASPVTTASYDRRSGQRVREAVNKRNLAIHDMDAFAAREIVADGIRARMPDLDGAAIGRVLLALGAELAAAGRSFSLAEVAAIAGQMTAV